LRKHKAPQLGVLFDRAQGGARVATGVASLPSILGTPTGGWGATPDEREAKAVSYPWASLSQQQLDSVRTINSNMNDLNSHVRTQAEELLAAAEEAGFKFRVNETVRSPDRQRYLFSQGRVDDPNSEIWHSPNIVTQTLDSVHIAGPEGGQALDLIWQPPSDDPKSTVGWDWIQANAPDYGFGVLGNWDPGHIEMKSVPSTAGRLRVT